MRTRTFTGQQMQEALQDLIVPWVEGAAPFVLLDTPPRVIGANRVTQVCGCRLGLKQTSTRFRCPIWAV